MNETQPAARTVEIDHRGRCGLGKIAPPGTYRATVRDDGAILLERVHIVTDAEIAALRDPKTM